MPEQFTQGPSILQSDIVNNLTTDSSTKPLSAAQGKVLDDKIQTVANSDSIGTFSSKSALDTAIDTLLSSVQSNGIHAFSFATSSAFEVFRSNASFAGTLYKSGSNTTFSNVEIFDIGTQIKIIGMRNGNGWSYGKVALNSDMANMAHIKKSNIPGNNSVNLQISLPAFVSVGRGSASNSTTTAFIDGWASTIYLSNNSSFTISLGNNETLTITNNTGGYCNYIVIY